MRRALDIAAQIRAGKASALEVLAEYLSQTKRAPFYQVLVEDAKLAPSVKMGNQAAELAGLPRRTRDRGGSR